jgi:hypothetical protein
MRKIVQKIKRYLSWEDVKEATFSRSEAAKIAHKLRSQNKEVKIIRTLYFPGRSDKDTLYTFKIRKK